jgi:membrane protease YdiL (CAAX protease family)
MGAIRSIATRDPVVSFYGLVFGISWGGVFILTGRSGLPGSADDVERLFLPALVVMFAGPSVAGIVMTVLVSGRTGLRELLSRLVRWRVAGYWYASAILLGPVLVTAILSALSLASPAFVPGIVTTGDRLSLLLFGLGWGLVGGGLLEELGWTGFAVPRLRTRFGPFRTGLIVGLLWGAWHFFIAFWASRAMVQAQPLWIFIAGFLVFYVLALPAYRVLMVWVYDRTASLLVALLMHAFLSASTLVLQPQETSGHLTWNLVLAATLWAIVAVIAITNHRDSAPRQLSSRAA